MLRLISDQQIHRKTTNTDCCGGNDLRKRFISTSFRIPLFLSSRIASIWRNFMICCFPFVHTCNKRTVKQLAARNLMRLYSLWQYPETISLQHRTFIIYWAKLLTDHLSNCDYCFVIQFFGMSFGILNEGTIWHQSCLSAGIWHSVWACVYT